MGCDPACIKTASRDNQGNRIMLSQSGNKKFPVAHTSHAQCAECLKAEIEEMKAAITLGPELAEKYQALQKKLNEP